MLAFFDPYCNKNQKFLTKISPKELKFWPKSLPLHEESTKNGPMVPGSEDLADYAS